MFQEAYLLLVEQFGPEHPHCVPAKRNVDIARQNAIMQLWHEVSEQPALRTLSMYFIYFLLLFSFLTYM